MQKRRIIPTLAVIAGVVLGIGSSAFSTNHPKAKSTRDPINYYWFQVKAAAEITPGNFVSDDDAGYISGSLGPTAPVGMGCSGASHYCVVGFTSDQVNGSPGTIKNNQVPAAQGNLKP